MQQDFQQRELTRRAQSDQPKHRPPSSGAAHWLRTVGVLAPLVIGEVAKDPDKRWRFIRISSVALALVSEGLYAHKVQQEREQWESERQR